MAHQESRYCNITSLKTFKRKDRNEKKSTHKPIVDVKLKVCMAIKKMFIANWVDLNEVGNHGTLGTLERQIVTNIGTKYKYKSFQRIECKTKPSNQS